MGGDQARGRVCAVLITKDDNKNLPNLSPSLLYTPMTGAFS